MKKMIGLAFITALLAIVLVYPGSAAALTNRDGFNPVFSAIPGNESFPAASASSFFDMFPLYIWIIFAVIILVIIILALFLVLAPGKKKKGGMIQQEQAGKPAKGEKGRKPRPEATPQPFAASPRAEEYSPNAMPLQGRMPRPVAASRYLPDQRPDPCRKLNSKHSLPHLWNSGQLNPNPDPCRCNRRRPQASGRNR